MNALRYLVHPADDVPGQWVGHCLDLDIISVGNSLSEAFAMTLEAVALCVEDDLRQGRNPHERKAAPAEVFAEWTRLKAEGSDRALEISWPSLASSV